MPQYGMVIPSRTDSIGIVHHSPLFLLQKKTIPAVAGEARSLFRHSAFE